MALEAGAVDGEKWWLSRSWSFLYPSPPPHSWLGWGLHYPLPGPPHEPHQASSLTLHTSTRQALSMIVGSYDSATEKPTGPFLVSLGSRPNLIWPYLTLWACVRFQGCRNKVPQPGWFKQQQFIVPLSGSWKSNIKVPTGLVSSEGLEGRICSLSLACRRPSSLSVLFNSSSKISFILD